MSTIKLIIKVVFYMCGSFCVLWGLFCFLGGPDGRTGSLDSIMIGTAFSVAGLGFIMIARYLNAKNQHRVTDRIREKLGEYPGAKFIVEDDCIIFIPNTDDGFEVRLVADPYRYFVSFDGWHEEFEDEDEAMKCFGFGLSEKCRLKVVQRGRMRYRWLLEFKIGDEWRPETETGLIFFPFWLRKTERYLQNHIIKES